MQSSTSEPVLRSRLLPKFSFRFLLFVTALAAILGAVARAAGDGAAFAKAALAAVVFPAICFALFAVAFFIAWLATRTLQISEDKADPANPFAEGQLPPQILPPRDPST